MTTYSRTSSKNISLRIASACLIVLSIGYFLLVTIPFYFYDVYMYSLEQIQWQRIPQIGYFSSPLSGIALFLALYTPLLGSLSISIIIGSIIKRPPRYTKKELYTSVLALVLFAVYVIVRVSLDGQKMNTWIID